MDENVSRIHVPAELYAAALDIGMDDVNEQATRLAVAALEATNGDRRRAALIAMTAYAKLTADL